MKKLWETYLQGIMEQINSANLPEDIDKIFGDHPTASAFYYIGFLEKYTEAQLRTSQVREISQRTAFCYGYLSALHKAHIYSPVLFPYEDEDEGIEMASVIVNYVETWLCCNVNVYEDKKDLVGLNTISFDLKEDIGYYLYADDACGRVRLGTLTNAFVTGYIAAFVQHHKYDRCLFLQEEERLAAILCDMITFEKSEFDARMARNRIIAQAFTTIDGGTEIPIPTPQE